MLSPVVCVGLKPDRRPAPAPAPAVASGGLVDTVMVTGNRRGRLPGRACGHRRGQRSTHVTEVAA